MLSHMLMLTLHRPSHPPSIFSSSFFPSARSPFMIAFFPAVFFWSVSYLHRFLLSSGFFSQIKRKLKKIPVSLLSDQTILCRLSVSFFLFLKDPVIHAFVVFHPNAGCIGIPGNSFAGYIQFLTDPI